MYSNTLRLLCVVRLACCPSFGFLPGLRFCAVLTMRHDRPMPCHASQNMTGCTEPWRNPLWCQIPCKIPRHARAYTIAWTYNRVPFPCARALTDLAAANARRIYHNKK